MKSPHSYAFVTIQAYVAISFMTLSFAFADTQKHEPDGTEIDLINEQLKGIESKTQRIRTELPAIKSKAQTITKHLPKISENIKKLDKLIPVVKENTKTIKENFQNTQDLKAFQRAEKAGLSEIIKAVSPMGGRFEIQSDGAIKIIPTNKKIVNKLLNESKAKETIQKSKGKTISKDSKEIIQRLQKANEEGLSNLLNQLATDGGNFELIENGGIRIIPNNSNQTKALSKKSLAANELVKTRKLNGLTKSLSALKASTNSWQNIKKIANQWIKESNKKGLSVGKIRHVKWLYIVSIVTKKGFMDTQLVIRSRDGKTVAFTQKTFEVFN